MANEALGRLWARWRPQDFPNAPRYRWEGFDPEEGRPNVGGPRELNVHGAHDDLHQDQEDALYENVVPRNEPIYANADAEAYFDAVEGPPLRRSQRVRQPNCRLTGYVLSQ
jgi:hypothetical protein